MRLVCRTATLAAIVFIAGIAAACGEPPNKEMHLAQGAIEAARAAGAERYAPEEFQAAVDALKRAEDAVAQRDYRLALSLALDSRERAQNSAREAATERAQARGLAERALANVTTALATTVLKLDAAVEAKVPAKALAGPREVLAATQKHVQEAGTLLGREDYVAAQRVLADRVSALNGASRDIDAAVAAAKAAPTRKPR